MKNLKSTFKKAYPLFGKVFKLLFTMLKHFGWGIDDEKAAVLENINGAIEEGLGELDLA